MKKALNGREFSSQYAAMRAETCARRSSAYAAMDGPPLRLQKRVHHVRRPITEKRQGAGERGTGRPTRFVTEQLHDQRLGIWEVER